MPVPAMMTWRCFARGTLAAAIETTMALSPKSPLLRR
jgi:hypothetical protein